MSVVIKTSEIAEKGNVCILTIFAHIGLPTPLHGVSMPLNKFFRDRIKYYFLLNYSNREIMIPAYYQGPYLN